MPYLSHISAWDGAGRICRRHEGIMLAHQQLPPPPWLVDQAAGVHNCVRQACTQWCVAWWWQQGARGSRYNPAQGLHAAA